MNQPIMVVLDPVLKAPQPAFEKAKQLAAAHNTSLVVAVNGYSSPMVRAVGYDKQRLEAATTQIRHAWEQRIASLASGMTCSAHVLWEKREIDALQKIILDYQPAMVVVHTSAESGLKRHLFTPRDWQLIRKAPCDVMCIHSQPWQSPPSLLLAVDPDTGKDGADALSIKVTGAAKALSAQVQGSLKACHVMDAVDDSLVLLMGEALSEFSGSLEDIKESQKAAFQRFASGEGLSADQVVLLEGPVAPTLSHYCKDNDVDLLIVGTVHRKLPERLLLGTTAEAVITRASCDVLVVKPDDFQTPWKS
ncbi:universal stress protein [Alcanivorax sp. S6407]|uniref:universal stress protein n=1 Tax=Alcanivorax sp. S6407 TaxID=2926424 RepID=UPI001FF4291F|nr:universal stress protein [Alcanivorax sp. S6407]